jgi:hypothetical protein
MKRIQSEHKNKISKMMVTITGTEAEDKSSIWYILLLTLAPLYLMVIIGAIVFALIMLDRHFIDLTNFMLQQYIFIVILIIGLIVAIIIYFLAVIHALRKIGMWQQNSHTKQANVGLLVLTIVASFMALPVLLALFFH